MDKQKKQRPAWLILLLITLIAGLALGGVSELTKEPIAAQASAQEEAARRSVLPGAETFVRVEFAEGTALDWCYQGLDAAQNTVGYACQIIVKGFGGEVAVIAGVEPDGKVTGLSVGGSAFSETPGLGARSKDAAFTGQFAGKTAPMTVIKKGETASDSTVDAITSATITSRAVTGGVNEIAACVLDIVSAAPAQ